MIPCFSVLCVNCFMVLGLQCITYTIQREHFMVLSSSYMYSPFLSPVNCSDPATPGNGFIEPYQNTTQGAEISFRCDSQFVPSTTRMAICGADGRWNPDPATHMCTCECPTKAYTLVYAPYLAFVPIYYVYLEEIAI